MTAQGRNKFHVRRGDEVIVIAGSARGRRGKIKQVLTKKSSVILEATDERSHDTEDKRRLVKPVMHFLRKSQQNPQGGLLWLEGAIHVSNVMKITDFEVRNTKLSQKS